MNTTLTKLFQDKAISIVLDEDDKPLFNANDVCEALEFANPRDALSNYADEEDVAKRDTLTPGGYQLANFINESGLYCLIFGSKKPAAKAFKRWVTSEVLPSIRKTGTYTLPEVDAMQRELAALHEAFGMDDPVNGFFAQLNEANTQRNSLQKSLADLTAKVTVHGTLKKHAVNVMTERDRGIEAARKFVAKELRPALKVTKRLRKLHKDDQITLSLLSDLELSVLRAGWIDEVDVLDE